MTLSDLGPQTLVSRNICYQQHQFLMRGLRDMSSDRRTDGQITATVMLPRNFFGKHKKNIKLMNAPRIASHQWSTLWMISIMIIKRLFYIWYTLSNLDLYIMTLSELCMKRISISSYMCGIWLTSVQKLLKLCSNCSTCLYWPWPFQMTMRDLSLKDQ
jgi:hypothetical protein